MNNLARQTKAFVCVSVCWIVAMGKPFRKQFIGVTLTDELRGLVQRVVERTTKGHDSSLDSTETPKIWNHTAADTTKREDISTSNDKRVATKNPLEDLFDAMDKTECMDILQSIDLTAESISVPAIRALRQSLALVDSGNDNDGKEPEKAIALLEAALKSTQLCYSVPPSRATERSEEEERQFQKRMDWLRCRQEESRYVKLTKNLGKVKADDVTTKSMMYAASVGLNMVVAPISFGVLMYFFGGSLLNFVFPRDTSHHHHGSNTTDIRRVILGVISGVAMLFIEMILFVIRTHEMEAALRKKERQKHNQKTGGLQPFGVYTKPVASTESAAAAATSTTTAKVPKRRSKRD
jgi:hypothetical protein